MHHADTIGPAALIARIEEYATEDPVFWRVPQLLRDMAKTGQTFSDLNKDF
jgi:3-hydroxyacyl-CoA dehydrogenase